MSPSPPTIAIRSATEDDRPAVQRLAALDCARVPTGDLLLALVDGELRAAVPVAGGRAIADPWHPSADLIALLEMRAARLRAARTTAAPSRRRLRFRARPLREARRATTS